MYYDNKAFSGVSAACPPSSRGYVQLYYSDTVNHCPACGHTQWHVGRQSAECAFCDTALALAVTYSRPPEPLFWFRGSATAAA